MRPRASWQAKWKRYTWVKCPCEASSCQLSCSRWRRWWQRLWSMRSVHASVNAARRSACATGILLVLSLPGFADTKEEPVILVLSATGSKLLRADTETPLEARPGDLLFSGDSLRTESGPASFLSCPAKTLDTLMPAGEVRLEAKAPKVKSGKI